MWLGGLFTASKQFIAQANNWSLEEQYLDVVVDFKGSLDDCSFGVTGLKLQGAQCKNNILSLSNSYLTDLPLTKLQWIRSVVQVTCTMSNKYNSFITE